MLSKRNVRVRVLDEQEEKGLFGCHMTDQCRTQNHSAVVLYTTGV